MATSAPLLQLERHAVHKAIAMTYMFIVSSRLARQIAGGRPCRSAPSATGRWSPEDPRMNVVLCHRETGPAVRCRWPLTKAKWPLIYVYDPIERVEFHFDRERRLLIYQERAMSQLFRFRSLALRLQSGREDRSAQQSTTTAFTTSHDAAPDGGLALPEAMYYPRAMKTPTARLPAALAAAMAARGRVCCVCATGSALQRRQ
jgi:hypothetical protein